MAFREVLRSSIHFYQLITASYLLPDWLKTAIDYCADLLQRLNVFSQKNAGLIAFFSLVATAAALVNRNAKRAASATSATPAAPGPPISRATRLSLLNEVDERAHVGHGLREAIRIDLNLTETPAAVPVGLRVAEDFRSDPRNERTTNEAIEQVFERAGGRLLILGEPGTGKTNLLLELARVLVKDARNDPEHPVPLLFSLARWTLAERTRTLAEWMKDDLHELYALTVADAEALIRDDAIIPLLDGLDEVDEERRAACMKAINEYQSNRSLGRFAVCCRSEEYARLLTRINAKKAIRVERLSPKDVEQQIARPELEHVRQLLAADPVLRKFVDTPLWLHVLYLGALAEPFASGADNPRDRLYDHYVSHVLRRRPEGARHRHTASPKLLRWLSWLATEMQNRHQTQFVLESLDFSWVTKRPVAIPPAASAQQAKTRAKAGRKKMRQARSKPQPKVPVAAARKKIRFMQRILFGLVVGLAAGLAGGWVFGVLVGTLAGFRLENRVEAAERLQFDWKRAISRWRLSLGYGAIFALAFGAVHGAIGGLYMWLVAVVFEMLQGGFLPRSGDGGRIPNSATRRSIHYALGVAFAGGAIASLAIAGARLAAASHLIGTATQGAVTDAAGWIAFGAIILGGEKGGWFAIRHYTVRILLWRQGVMPAAYVRFLNEGVERLFLVRRGGSYEFIHLTFRDYMAAKCKADRDIFQEPKSITESKHSNYPGAATIALARLHTPRLGS